jgi:hypothetical protein
MPEVIEEHPNRPLADWFDRVTMLSDNPPNMAGDNAARRVQDHYSGAINAVGDVMARRAELRNARGDGEMSAQLTRILEGMREAARQAGVDPSDTIAVLRHAERTDPTDSTMEAAAAIRSFLGGGHGAAQSYPQQRR